MTHVIIFFKDTKHLYKFDMSYYYSDIDDTCIILFEVINVAWVLFICDMINPSNFDTWKLCLRLCLVF